MKKYWLELTLIVVFVMLGLLLPCKYSFECHRDKDICTVNKGNIIGMLIFQNTFKLSDIKDVRVNKYFKDEIHGQRYVPRIETVEYYDLNFVMKDGEIIENVLNHGVEFDMIAIEKAKKITKFLNTPNINDYKMKDDNSLLQFIFFSIAGMLALGIFIRNRQKKK